MSNPVEHSVPRQESQETSYNKPATAQHVELTVIAESSQEDVLTENSTALFAKALGLQVNLHMIDLLILIFCLHIGCKTFGRSNHVKFLPTRFPD